MFPIIISLHAGSSKHEGYVSSYAYAHSCRWGSYCDHSRRIQLLWEQSKHHSKPKFAPCAYEWVCVCVSPSNQNLIGIYPSRQLSFSSLLLSSLWSPSSLPSCPSSTSTLTSVIEMITLWAETLPTTASHMTTTVLSLPAVAENKGPYTIMLTKINN